MKLAAIEKAKNRLDTAGRAIVKLEAADTYEQFNAAWTEFLIFHNTFYNVLGKGARNTPQAQQWFFSADKANRKDPLFSYLIQARNADEHGIEPITALEPGHLDIGIPPSAKQQDGTIRIGKLSVQARGSGVTIATDHSDIPLAITPPSAKLVPVTDDRYGTIFPPPSEHLGRPLEDQSPLNIAKLGYAYAQKMLKDAEKFQKR